MHFQRLKISGFKSFADPTEFRIEPGVTGIVGPNGCGKYNILESMRWVMGANSAKAMRAGVAAMGLSIWAASEGIASPTATAVRTPEGIDEAALRREARARYGVVFSAGRGETLGKLTRIGHMGPTAQPIYAIAALTALGGAINGAGRTLDIGKGIDAALAVIDAAA